IAAAARRIEHRRYDIEVPRRIEGRTRARLQRNGAPYLQWDVRETTILAPPPFSDINLREGFARWALGTLSQDEAEAALVLRRCTLISLGRTKNLDAQHTAKPTGHCFVQQPQRAQRALRMVGSTRDFTAAASEL